MMLMEDSYNDSLILENIRGSGRVQESREFSLAPAVFHEAVRFPIHPQGPVPWVG